jgi:hypothetical protein
MRVPRRLVESQLSVAQQTGGGAGKSALRVSRRERKYRHREISRFVQAGITGAR